MPDKLYFVIEIKPWDPDIDPNPQAPGHALYVNGVPYASEEDFIKEVRSSVLQDVDAMNDGNVSWNTAVLEIAQEDHPLMVGVFEDMFRRAEQAARRRG